MLGVMRRLVLARFAMEMGAGSMAPLCRIASSLTLILLVSAPAAADQPATVGEQDNLEEDGGLEGGRAFGVVAVAGVEQGEVEFVVDEVAQGVLETAGDHLSLEVHRQEHHAFVFRFVAGHGDFLVGRFG